jgi:hypothetical protein
MSDIALQAAADNDHVATFFERLWGPNPGHRALFVLAVGKHYFALKTVEALEALEGLKGDPGYAPNIYHACGLFSVGRRQARCSLGARAFWLDIDCGLGKPYRDQVDATRALLDFCNRCSLPTPSCVNSGGGVHAYWFIDQLVPPAEWLEHARGLKMLCQRHGLEADRTRTADLASVLRPPGTINRKDGIERPVYLFHLEDPRPLLDFAVFKAVGVSVQPSASNGVPISRELIEPHPGNRDQVYEALLLIDPDIYENWLVCGMALHESRWTCAKAMWDAWSAQSSKCNEKKSQDQQWAEFDRRDNTWQGSRVRLGTIIEVSKRATQAFRPKRDPFSLVRAKQGMAASSYR